AVPLADAGVKYAADVSRSIVAQVSDALRTPLLGTETTTVRTTRRGIKTTTTKAAIPAWAAVAGAVLAAWWFAPAARPSTGSGFSWNPFSWITSLTPVAPAAKPLLNPFVLE